MSVKLKSNSYLLLWKNVQLQIKIDETYNPSFHAGLGIPSMPITWGNRGSHLPTFFNYSEIDPRNFYVFDPEQHVLEQQEQQELDKNAINMPLPETIPAYSPLDSMPERIMDIKSQLQELRHKGDLEPIGDSSLETGSSLKL